MPPHCYLCKNTHTCASPGPPASYAAIKCQLHLQPKVLLSVSIGWYSKGDLKRTPWKGNHKEIHLLFCETLLSAPLTEQKVLRPPIFTYAAPAGPRRQPPSQPWPHLSHANAPLLASTVQPAVKMQLPPMATAKTHDGNSFNNFSY